MADVDRLREIRGRIQQAALDRWQRRAQARSDGLQALATGGAGAADSPMRNARFQARTAILREAESMRRRGTLPLFIERKIGPTLDFLSAAPSDAARKAGRPAARLVSSIDPQIQADGFATGFLIAPQILMTNWHVFPTMVDAVSTGANFLYERDEHGIQRGVTFAIDPDLFFLTDETLDYALVGVKSRSVDGRPLEDLGMIALIEATPKILKGQLVNIIEYPEGKEKQYATKDNRLVDILDEGFLHYETDTLEGASGSPAFSESWELVALHHASIPEVRDGKIIATDGSPWNEEMGDDAVHWIANEGIRVSAIVQSLSKKVLENPVQAKILTDLLANTTDPVDDLTQHLAQTGGASTGSTLSMSVGESRGLSLGIGDATMASNQFTFTGPVNIHVYAPTAVPVSPVPQVPAEVAVEKTIRFDRNYDDRLGYDEAFLGAGDAALSAPKPGVIAARASEILTGSNGEPIELLYRHFTIVMNAERRLQMWSAVNVNYDPALKSGSRTSFGTDKWIPDPRIPERAQIFDSEIYGPAHQIDRGHIVRREDNAWGDSPDEIEYANSDTFHWTNCTPQHQAFNRESPGSAYGGQKGLWGDFEKYVQTSLQQGDTKACILAGPVLDAQDPTADFGAGAVQYPIVFWKVVVVSVPVSEGRQALKAFGFVLSQKDVVDRFGIEAFQPGRFSRYQQSLADITRLSGVTFDPALLAVDTKAAAADG